MNENKNNISYYPGHMAKTRRQILENIDLIDIIYEVVDARAPFSSKITDVDNLIKNKTKILIMTKKDLCNLEETNKWVNYYEKAGYKVLLLDLKDNKDYKMIVNLTKKCTIDIQNKREERGLLPKEIKALVIGIPNVGKSTLINQMAGRKVAEAANKPGVTKSLRFLPTSFGITILDTPGILWPKFEDQNVAKNIAVIGSIKKEVLNLYDIISHFFTICNEHYPHIITDYYKIELDEPLNEIECLARRLGFVKNDEIDYTRVCDKVYNDITSGKVKDITLDICK